MSDALRLSIGPLRLSIDVGGSCDFVHIENGTSVVEESIVRILGRELGIPGPSSSPVNSRSLNRYVHMCTPLTADAYWA
jgi:hypothetical protein